MEDDGAGEFIVGHACPIGGFENVDTVPFSGALRTRRNPWKQIPSAFPQYHRIYTPQRQQHTLLQKDNTRKPIIQIPEVNTPNTALIVQITVDIKRLVGRNLELPHPLTGHGSIIKRRIKFIAPGRSVAVTVSVVVAEQVVALGLRTTANLQGLVDGGEKVFGEIGDDTSNCLKVALCVAGIETPEEVPG